MNIRQRFQKASMATVWLCFMLYKLSLIRGDTYDSARIVINDRYRMEVGTWDRQKFFGGKR